jgi:hypothetical protein
LAKVNSETRWCLWLKILIKLVILLIRCLGC